MEVLFSIVKALFKVFWKIVKFLCKPMWESIKDLCKTSWELYKQKKAQKAESAVGSAEYATKSKYGSDVGDSESSDSSAQS